jgi:hypothetical protein
MFRFFFVSIHLFFVLFVTSCDAGNSANQDSATVADANNQTPDAAVGKNDDQNQNDSHDASSASDNAPATDTSFAEVEEEVKPDPAVCQKLKPIEGKWYQTNEFGEPMDWSYTVITLWPEATTCHVTANGKNSVLTKSEFFGIDLPLSKVSEDGTKVVIQMEKTTLCVKIHHTKDSVSTEKLVR